jgi:hypothetical protein
MHNGRLVTWGAWFIGLVFVILGLVEVSVRVLSSEPIDAGAIAFWSLSLCGGGALILAGRFLVPRPSGVSIAMVSVGCVAGSLATMWTLVLPALAIALLVLNILDQQRTASAGPASP